VNDDDGQQEQEKQQQEPHDEEQDCNKNGFPSFNKLECSLKENESGPFVPRDKEAKLM